MTQLEEDDEHAGYKVAEMYLEEYYRHREAGDDPMNARLRIVEQGCPPDISMKVQQAAGESD